MTMIHDVNDLAGALGVEPGVDAAETVRRIERAVYRATECGAWVALREVPGPVVTRRYVVRLDDGLLGPCATGWRRVGERGGFRGFLDAPVALLFFLDPFEGHRGRALLPLPAELGASMAAVRESVGPNCGPDLLWVERPALGRHVVVIAVEEREAGRPGVAVGSSVEGSDAEVMPEVLAFPFTLAAWERAVAGVEEEAGRLWWEANAGEARS